jgi:hypothetical protein
MDEPASANGPPPFTDPFDDADVEQRIFGTVLQVREPTTATTIANRSDCDPKTARKYLSWFADLGIVTEHPGRPATFERNDQYFEWRRVNDLATNNTVEELRRRVRDVSERIETYEKRYDATAPGAVDAIAAAQRHDDVSIDDVYADLADWTTRRRERERLERARRERASANSEQASG